MQAWSGGWPTESRGPGRRERVITPERSRREASVGVAAAACRAHLARPARAADTVPPTDHGRRGAANRWQRARRCRQHGDVGLVLTQRSLRDRLVAAINRAVAGAHVGRCRAVRVHGARLVIARHCYGRSPASAHEVGGEAQRPSTQQSGGCLQVVRAVRRRRAGQWRSFRGGVGSVSIWASRDPVARGVAAVRCGWQRPIPRRLLLVEGRRSTRLRTRPRTPARIGSRSPSAPRLNRSTARRGATRRWRRWRLGRRPRRGRSTESRKGRVDSRSWSDQSQAPGHNRPDPALERKRHQR